LPIHVRELWKWSTRTAGGSEDATPEDGPLDGEAALEDDPTDDGAPEEDVPELPPVVAPTAPVAAEAAALPVDDVAPDSVPATWVVTCCVVATGFTGAGAGAGGNAGAGGAVTGGGGGNGGTVTVGTVVVIGGMGMGSASAAPASTAPPAATRIAPSTLTPGQRLDG
jgi:hypothetical protein